jgi:ABC-type uncharacterized transport system auxiliary subunit
MSKHSLPLLASIVLGGCSAATVPDFTYFRLPRSQPVEALAAPVFRLPIVVELFSADGLYSDQALIYAIDPEAQQLRQYHYQLWTDPPTRILQRRMIAQLRDLKISHQVTDELPASKSAIRVRGVLLRFDRVQVAEGSWHAVVALKLRADGPDGMPLVDDYYRAEQPTTSTDLKATVDAYGAALDTIFAQFQADLGKHGADIHAG